MLQISGIQLKYDEPYERIPFRIAKKLRIAPDAVLSFHLARVSVDARKKPDVVKVCTVHFNVKDEAALLKRHSFLKVVPPVEKRSVKGMPTHPPVNPPIVVGSGPAGMFAAYELAAAGYRPLVIERGAPVEERVKQVRRFWEEGILDPESNVQFGEGGAGTFSDGKLTTRIKDPRIGRVLQILVDNGAPEEILYLNKPHIGTDRLRSVMIRMRRRILEWGGSFHFNTRMVGMESDGTRITGIQLDSGQILKADVVVLAIGNGARDTFEMLHAAGIAMESKPFAVGFRIEHLQARIDRVQYGRAEIAQHLGAADYHLTHHSEAGRSIYTFCMCPGGQVIAAASEPEHLVVNGMSVYARDFPNANSAVIVAVDRKDFGSDHPLAGLAFQRGIEHAAFVLGGSYYTAPVQTVGAFLQGHVDPQPPAEISPSYRPGVRWCDLRGLYPESITEALQEALAGFGAKLDGFDGPDAILTGVETRSSSPVRILRTKDTMESLSLKGLYPIGEGAGYAGGITSSAVDGIKIYEYIDLIYNNIDKS